MLKQMCLNFLLLLALTSGGASPGDATQQQQQQPSQYNQPDAAAVMHQQQQIQQQQQQQQMKQQQPYKQGSGGAQPNLYGGGSPSVAVTVQPPQAVATPASYQAGTAGSGGPPHLGEHRNSYNLLSEAMSQAVSNEFSSGSADGACQADDLDCYSGNVQDRLGMEAIRSLHQQLDDDDNGNIDLSESDDFLREELKYDSGYEKRQKVFHFNDDMHISVKELWEAWLRSEVHNWTIEQTTDWLAQSVQLPQYVELFKIHKVTGAALPRLAVTNMHYVSSVLGIKDPIHKQKIALKAMDVVLFGPPRETGTRWKDYILVTLLLSAIIGCWYAYQQNKNAKRHLRRMAQDMEGLQRAEQSLQEMQKELERARMEQENVATEKLDLERRLKEAPSLSASSSDLEVQQLKKEIEMLRSELSRAEIELVDNCWAPPPQLQSWLQYTYELENKNHLKKRVSAEKQLQSAREACEKLRKKRTSLVGAFVSTHGKSIDDVDRSIVEARNSLSEVTNELQERLHRWKQIESCMGFNIVNNNGLPYLESILYGRNGGGGSSSTMGSIKGSRGRMTSSTDDLDDESVQGMFDTYNSRSSLASSFAPQPAVSSSLNHASGSVIRDDSSGSDDGADNQSVQFYLGTSAPTTPAIMAIMPNVGGGGGGATAPTGPHGGSPMRSLPPTQGPSSAAAMNNFSDSCSPSLDDGHHHHHHNHQHHPNQQQQANHHQHSPSVSSEGSSITVPPRTKKHKANSAKATTTGTTTTTTTATTIPPITTITQALPPGIGTVAPPPPPPSGPIGRTPLPPPRKSATQSQILRSQYTEPLVPLEVYQSAMGRERAYHQQQHQQQSAASAQQQYQQQQQHQLNSGAGQQLGPAALVVGAAGNKKMVKQHSTASQQSSSSTSSSVQSAPPSTEAASGGCCHRSGNVGGCGSCLSAAAARISPGRWSSSHDRIHHLLQQQQQQYHGAVKEPFAQPGLSGGGIYANLPPPPELAASGSGAGHPLQRSAALSGHSLQSLCVAPGGHQHQLQYQHQLGMLGGDAPQGAGTAATASAAARAPPHGDTELEQRGAGPSGARSNSSNASDTASLDGSLKKRKRRLRFPFGKSSSSVSSQSAAAAASSGGAVTGHKSKHA